MSRTDKYYNEPLVSDVFYYDKQKGIVENSHRNGLIYKITSPSGKIYIGKSVMVNNRICRYRNGHLGSQRALKNSVSKHGWDKHVFEIIDCAGSSEALSAREIYWISFYKSLGVKMLNLTNGGEGTFGYKMTEDQVKRLSEAAKQRLKLNPQYHSEETKRKISQSNMGKKMSEESKIKLSIARKGIRPTLETRIKLSEALKKRDRNAATKENWITARRRPILCKTNNTQYISVTEAAKLLNIDQRLISAVLTGKQKTTNGLEFEYLNKEKTYINKKNKIK